MTVDVPTMWSRCSRRYIFRQATSRVTHGLHVNAAVRGEARAGAVHR